MKQICLIQISQWKRTSIKSLQPREQHRVSRQLCRARTAMVPAGGCAGGCRAPAGSRAPCRSGDSPAAGNYGTVSTDAVCRAASKPLMGTIGCTRLQEGMRERDRMKPNWITLSLYCPASEHLWHQATNFGVFNMFRKKLPWFSKVWLL